MGVESLNVCKAFSRMFRDDCDDDCDRCIKSFGKQDSKDDALSLRDHTSP